MPGYRCRATARSLNCGQARPPGSCRILDPCVSMSKLAIEPRRPPSPRAWYMGLNGHIGHRTRATPSPKPLLLEVLPPFCTPSSFFASLFGIGSEVRKKERIR